MLTAPLVPLALACHLIVIPRFGSIGAAAVTTLLAIMGAVEAVFVVYHLWDLVPPAKTLWRSVAVAALVLGFIISWPVSGMLTLVKLVVSSIVIVLAYFLLGEFSVEERALAWSLLKMRLIPAQHPTES
jgi:hypothetical protein